MTTQTAAFLTATELINSGMLELSLNGRFALIVNISDASDSLVYRVCELMGGEWVEIYYASESYEDAADVFGIYDEADFDSAFDLFDNAAAAVLAVAA